MTQINQTINKETLAATTGFCDIPCPLCQSHVFMPMFSTKDYNWRFPGMFRYVKCGNCRIVYQNPCLVPDKIMGFYPKGYGSGLCAETESIETEIKTDIYQIRASLISRFISDSPQTLLDIGCGSGFFLEYMRRRSWQVQGIEPSCDHVAFAKTHLHIKDVWADLWPPKYPVPVKSNVVTLFHVIEHFPDPIKSLQAVHDVLSPDGILVLETPNIESWPARIFGKRWVALDAPRHLCLFSKQTLRQCVEKAGFEVLGLNTFSPSTMEYSESIRYALEDAGLRTSQKPLSDFAKMPDDEQARCVNGTSAQRVPVKQRLHVAEKMFFNAFNIIAKRFGSGCNLFLVASHKHLRE